ncbi:EF-hand domain-containing protein [Pseudoduganella sp. HUAS MS19]
MKVPGLIAAALLSAQAMAGPEVDRQFTSMDADRDGKVSAAEHAAGAKAMFGKMDANRDGKVTAAEMTAAHTAVTGHTARTSDMPAADKIKAVDSDGDGLLSADEHAKGSASMLAKMDTDKNGFLSKEEMAAGHAAMLKK